MATLTGQFFDYDFVVTKTFVGNGECVDCSIFVAPEGFSCEFLGASEVHTTAGNDAGTVQLMLTRQQGTEAAASGDSLLTTAFDMKGTAQTVQNGAIAAPSVRKFAAGDRLGANFIGTLTTLAGVTVTAYFRRT
jgi:hypothetical protein